MSYRFEYSTNLATGPPIIYLYKDLQPLLHRECVNDQTREEILQHALQKGIVTHFGRKDIKGLSDDVNAATRTAWNLKEGGADLDVGIMKCDNAGQIITGTLIGLGKEGMVDHQKSYSVLALATLLRLDGLLEEHGSFEYTTSNSGRQQSLDKEVSSTAKECAVSTYNTIKKHAPCLIKVCNTHTLLAQARGVKKMKNKPREIVLFKTQYENIFGGFAKRARHA